MADEKTDVDQDIDYDVEDDLDSRAPRTWKEAVQRQKVREQAIKYAF